MAGSLLHIPRPLVPRLKLDIGWRDFLLGAGYLVLYRNAPAAQQAAERAWGTENHVLATLCVRSGFDLLLAALSLPAGSEVMLSAITIEHMADIISAHGLVPVPVDIDRDTLEPSLDAMHERVSPRTRMLLVAHLFGSRVRMEPIAQFAAEHNLLLVEDCAQAFTGERDCVHQSSLAAMFSFGAIKSATALGGAIIVVRDNAILSRMRELQREYPLQPVGEHAAKLARFTLLKFLSIPRVFGLLYWWLTVRGKDFEKFLGGSPRAFAGRDLLDSIRRRPCAALMRLVQRRLLTYDSHVIEQRTLVGQQMMDGLKFSPLQIAGRLAPGHTYWVFPASAREPDELCHALRAEGFDATPGASSMRVIPDVLNSANDCPGARSILQGILYLPVQAGLSRRDVDLLVAAINRHAQPLHSPAKSHERPYLR